MDCVKLCMEDVALGRGKVWSSFRTPIFKRATKQKENFSFRVVSVFPGTCGLYKAEFSIWESGLG